MNWIKNKQVYKMGKRYLEYGILRGKNTRELLPNEENLRKCADHYNIYYNKYILSH